MRRRGSDGGVRGGLSDTLEAGSTVIETSGSAVIEMGALHGGAGGFSGDGMVVGRRRLEAMRKHDRLELSTYHFLRVKKYFLITFSSCSSTLTKSLRRGAHRPHLARRLL